MPKKGNRTNGTTNFQTYLFLGRKQVVLMSPSPLTLIILKYLWFLLKGACMWSIWTHRRPFV